MKENWTKGEWVANVYERGEFDVSTNPEGSVGGTLILCSRNRFDDLAEEMHANANLIAAAPKLYEALKAMTEDFKRLADSGDSGFWNAEDQPEYQQAMQAIAAARGEDDNKAD